MSSVLGHGFDKLFDQFLEPVFPSP